jgi:hypothetical protein
MLYIGTSHYDNKKPCSLATRGLLNGWVLMLAIYEVEIEIDPA